jgi:hypothetical protein
MHRILCTRNIPVHQAQMVVTQGNEIDHVRQWVLEILVPVPALFLDPIHLDAGLSISTTLHLYNHRIYMLGRQLMPLLRVPQLAP